MDALNAAAKSVGVGGAALTGFEGCFALSELSAAAFERPKEGESGRDLSGIYWPGRPVKFERAYLPSF